MRRSVTCNVCHATWSLNNEQALSVYHTVNGIALYYGHPWDQMHAGALNSTVLLNWKSLCMCGNIIIITNGNNHLALAIYNAIA